MLPLARLLLLPLLLLTGSLSAQLNGTYTVGPTGTYTTLAAAITALETVGVNGPVFMDLQAGSYTGDWLIGTIPGTNATNIVTFRSQALDNTQVTLVSNSVFLLRLVNVAYLRIEHLTFSVMDIGIWSGGGSITDLHITDCRFLNSSNASSAISFGGINGGGLVISRNTITGYESGVGVSGNTFYQNVTIEDNTITGASRGGIFLGDIRNATMQRNTVRSTTTPIPSASAGILMRQCERTLLCARNVVEWAFGNAGIQLEQHNASGLSQVATIENNMIAIGGTASTAGLLVTQSNSTRIRHNSIRSTINIPGMTVGSSSYVEVIGNAVQTMAYYCLNTSATGSTFDRNVYFCTQPNVVIQAGTPRTWAAWQGLGFDTNSLFANPLFVSMTDLHLQAGSPAQDLLPLPVLVATDIDGTLRGTATTLLPDAGAHERTDACAAGLSGTYPIGPASLFPTFTSAINTMVSCGITGPVVFEVADGTYTEQIVLPNIPGNSTTNTITFRGQSLNNTLVTLTWPTGSGAPSVRMSGADRVTFEHITIQRTGTATLPGAVVDWESTIADATTRSEYTTIRNCRLISSATSNALSALVLGLAQNDENEVNIIDCVLQGGHTGVRWTMDSQVSLAVRGCTFSGQYNRAIACVTPGASDPELMIENNIIQAPTFAGTTAVQVEHGSNFMRVTGNRITVPTSNGIGIDITNGGIDPYWTQVANNMVQCTGTARGIRMVGNNTGLGLYHNAVSTQFGYALELPGTGSGNYMVGNALRSNNTYIVFRAGTVTFTQADHNAFFTPLANFVWWGTPMTDLQAWRCATGQQLNSIQADPLFVNNTTDLHLQSGSPCAGQSIFLSGLDFDFDAELRALPLTTLPDIGADEINADCTFIAGTYVIGPSFAADFPTFNAAVGRLLSCGINGPVVFEVENGTYTEQVALPKIKGTSSVNTITFRGQALDSSLVILQWPSATTTTNNHVLRVHGGDHVRFEHMTLRRTGTFTNARVLHIDPTCDAVHDLRLAHCALSNSSTATLTAELVSRAIDATPTSLELLSCALQGGSYAVNWQGSAVQDSVSISGCIRTGGAYGIEVQQIGGPVSVVQNELVSSTTDAVLVGNCTGAIEVLRNRITGGSGSISAGVFISGCAPAPPARVLVANNEVIFSGGCGIRINGPSARVDVVYNSVQMLTTGRLALLAINGFTSTDTRIRNNIFSSIGTHAASVSLTGITAERNMFWRTGLAGPTVYWNSAPYTTAAALIAGSGTNAGTLYQDPLFFAHVSDLRSYAMQADQAAAPFAGITVDKNGQPRHATTPDIGAFEFQPTLWNEAFNTCSAADPIVSTGTGQDQWIYKDRKVVARFNDNGQNLGTVTLSVYLNNGPVRQSLIGQRYMDRNWHLVTQNPITTGAIVRLFHSANEFATYAAADPVVSVYADAGIAHYAGANENCQLTDNPAGNAWMPLFPAAPSVEPRIQGAGGTHGYTAVVAFDGEFYITSMGSPLPVELISFTAQRADERTVALAWTTATERDNAGFEVWRMIEGEEAFTEVGWVDGVGNSQQFSHYAFDDDNGSDRTSYYRIVQVDFDGTATASEVVPVQGVVKQASWSLFPNPARERFSIQGLPEVVEVLLMDGAGRQVERWSGAEVLHLPDLASGLYLVQVRLASGTVEQQRLMLE